ncbi:peptidoglycan DD-metalloendopeptidase family protein [Staphylococcus xylosus]|uniref:peptidoglycan DD-metalloendopeptidase family protein n=1 Tax=Staphylococcus xylosus TaxID=1288 RepID=UPI002DBC0C30|nr:peptidoglycan DD-metalloendopeptidase family protein [Staphylococcus xylosus]MEB7800404.1 peptidoglycan DD-metalloendopeptidase family protein [Staphylococcus xylosus]
MADFNLSAEVSMDVDPLKASKTTIERNLKAINKSLRDQRKEMKQNEVSAESLAKQETDLGRAVKLQEGLLKQRNKTLNDMQRQMKESNNVTDEQKLKLQNASRAVQQAENQLNNYENELKQTQTQQKLLGRTTDQVKNSLGQLRNEAKLTEMRFKQSEKSVSGYKNRLAELSHTMQKQKAHTDLLKGNLRELERAQQGNSREAKGLRNDLIKEAIAFQILQGRIDETTDELKEYQRQQRLMGTATNAWVGARQQMDRIATTLRSLGELTQGIVGGVMTTHFSALVPILGSVVSLGAGLGGMLLAAAGGAIGMGGAFGIAGVAVKAFAGQATYALKMLEDGQLKVTKEVTAYKGALDGLKTSWEGLIAQNQAAIFNTMTNGINTAKYALTTLNPFLTKTATQIETASGKMLNWAKTSSVAKRAFDILNTQGPKIFQHLLNATQSFVNGSAALFNKLSPLYIWGAKGFSNMAKSFNNWANSVQGSKAINGFIEYTKTNLPIVGNIFGNIFKGIISLFQAFSGHSHNVLLGIKDVTKGFAEWSEGLKKSDGFQKFIEYLEVNGPKVWTLVKNITSTLWGLAKGMAPVGSAVLSISGAFFKWTATMTNAHPLIGKILGLLTAFGGVTLLAAKPILLFRGALLGATGASKLFGKAGAFAKIQIGLVAAKAKIASAGVAIWTGVTKAATLATKLFGLSFKALGRAIYSVPVFGWVLLAVTALTAGIVLLWKKNEGFRNAVIAIWNGIKAAAISVFGFIKPYVIAIWNAIKTSTVIVWNAIKKTAITVWNAIKFAVQNPIKALKIVLTVYWTAIKTVAIKLWNALKTGVVNVVKALVKGIKWYINTVKTVISTVFNAAKNIAIKIWTLIKNRIISSAKAIWTGVRNTFNALKKGVSAIFNGVKNFAIKVWTTLRNKVEHNAKMLWIYVKAVWTVLGRKTRAIFNSVKNFLISVWNNIKNRVVNFAKSLWNGVRNTFNSLSKGTRNIFNSVKKFAFNLWNNLKNGVVSRVKSLWSGVRNTWNSLKKGTSNIFGAVSRFMKDKWNNIKSSTINIANTLKDKVTGAFGKMRDVLKGIIDKIKGFISDMVDKVKGGLNKLIDGVNWVGKKLGMDKIDPINFHTGTTHTQTNVVKNGKIAKDTLATVGDKGKGNGPGGFRHETIIPPKGKPFITPARDTTMPISKGTAILNGAQTHAMLSNSPQFSKGTLPRFASGTKKKKDENLWDKTKNIAGDFGEGVSDTAHGIKENTQKALEASAKAIGKGKKWLGDKVGDVMDWVGKPGKLLNNILDAFGVNMNAFGISKDASLPFDMMKGMFGKLKDAAKNLIKGWMEDAAGGEGDAAWLLKHDIWQKFGNYTGGLGFNGGKHYGVDFGMTPGTNVKAVAGGKISKVWNDYGGGKSIEIDIGKGLTNQYMHLSKQLVKKGQRVGVGDLIAKSGNTGNFTAGSGHLHFQLNKKGVPQSNVLEWLKGLGGGGKKSPSKWKSTIKKAAKKMKVNLSGSELNGIVAQIQRESNGDAGVTQGNIGDINNLRGTPAQGLLQYVPSTFKSYAMKGHTNIKSGYDQLLAFFNNKNWRKDLPYGRSGWGPSGGRRYATGTNNARRGFNQVFEKGGEIMQMRGGETVIPNDVSIQAFKQIATSDIFSRTQSAVYDAISQYADQLREKQQMATREQQELSRLSRENTAVKEQNGILKETLETMKAILGELTNVKSTNEQIRDKDYFPDSRTLTKKHNENMALNAATQLMR